MENIIAGLLKDLENGKISRRQLMQGLAVGVVGASVPSRLALAQGGKGFKSSSVDHISYQVSDYKRTRDFYMDLLGMSVSNDNGTNTCYLRFGNSVLIARTPATPLAKPTVDHIAYKTENWDTNTAKAEVERRGLRGDRAATPRLDVPATPTFPNYVSYHVADPDGYDVEIAGIAQAGDSQYKAGAVASPVTPAPQGGKGFKAIFVNHISYAVSNYKQTRDFYSDLMGMAVSNDDGKSQCYLRFGDTVLIARDRSPANPNSKPPVVDHMAYMIENWDTDKVKAELERRGLHHPSGGPLRVDIPAAAPQPHYISFHIADPEGFDVEICGVAKPGDSQYNAKPNVQNAVPAPAR